MKRTFIAVKIPVSGTTAEIIQDIKSELQDEKIKWVETFNMHITLFFVGETHDEMIQKISSELENLLKNKKPFTLKGEGIGLFKNFNNPRVLWLGIEKSEYLEQVKKEIDQMMRNFGFAIENREFKPHLTLGRIKRIDNKSKLKNILNHYMDVNFHDFYIDKIIYYESRLTSSGPVYKVIKQVALI